MMQSDERREEEACILLGLTLLALNFVGEGLREAFDPKRARK